ncbi:MAG: hypothetical protein MI865_14010, partial [Proteobacteria bacterium]|nr:hypothetical protein [Pseudomonadota bacterium]
FIPAQAEQLDTHYTESDFLKIVLGKTKDEVRKVLGEPIDIATKKNMTFWLYKSIVQQGKSEKCFKYTQLAIINGIVQNVGNSNRALK